MSIVIDIKNLTKDYETGFWRKRRVRALDDLTLKVGGEQIFGFLGGNGAGKTTTIKILMSLLFPTAGRAHILGRDIGDAEMHREIGYCPENPYFYDYLTAVELLDYFGSLFGLSRQTRRERSRELLRNVGLEEKDWNKQLRKFSKGMLQRVGLAQSLVNDPQIVFLDEPMSGLDPVGRREVRELIAGLRRDGKTVFMSTHILSDVEALCDEVAILRGGRLSAAGRLDQLLAAEAGTRGFEIQLRGVDAARMHEKFGERKQVAAIDNNAAGATVTVTDDSIIDEVIADAREAGGGLISVQSVRQSLEDLFTRVENANFQQSNSEHE